MGSGLNPWRDCAIALATGCLTVGCVTINQAPQAPPSPSATPKPPVTQQPNNPPKPPTAQQPPTTQPLFCEGRMENGWGYTAEFANGTFTRINWDRAGQEPQISTLTFSETNAQGERIYRGAFRAATGVTLVDLSRGNVSSGSEVSVGVEEWGWSRGRCRS